MYKAYRHNGCLHFLEEPDCGWGETSTEHIQDAIDLSDDEAEALAAGEDEYTRPTVSQRDTIFDLILAARERDELREDVNTAIGLAAERGADVTSPTVALRSAYQALDAVVALECQRSAALHSLRLEVDEAFNLIPGERGPWDPMQGTFIAPTLVARVKSLKDELESAQATNFDLRERSSGVYGERDRLKAERDTLRSKIAEMESSESGRWTPRVGNLEAKVAALTAELAEAKSSKAKLDEAIAEDAGADRPRYAALPGGSYVRVGFEPAAIIRDQHNIVAILDNGNELEFGDEPTAEDLVAAISGRRIPSTAGVLDRLVEQIMRLRAHAGSPAVDLDLSREGVADALGRERSEVVAEQPGSPAARAESADCVSVAVHLIVAHGGDVEEQLEAAVEKLTKRLDHVEAGGTWEEAKKLEALRLRRWTKNYADLWGEDSNASGG